MIKVKMQGEKLKVNIQKRVIKEIQSASTNIPIEIGDRTRAGKSPTGKNNRNYSPDYLKYRLEKDRNGNPVRLYFSNVMLNAIQKYDISNGAKISFNDADARKIAYKHEFVGVGRNHKKTPFFDLDEKQKKKITSRIDKITNKISKESVSFSKG